MQPRQRTLKDKGNSKLADCMVDVKAVLGLIVLIFVGGILVNAAIDNSNTLFAGALFWGGVAFIIIPIAFIAVMILRMI